MSIKSFNARLAESDDSSFSAYRRLQRCAMTELTRYQMGWEPWKEEEEEVEPPPP